MSESVNQTIDGVLVSRELLESFAAYVADSPNAIMRSRAELLRALLDAPAVERKPVAWQRKWAFDKEKPYKEKNENGRMAWARKFIFHAVTENKLFLDDVALYAEHIYD